MLKRELLRAMAAIASGLVFAVGGNSLMAHASSGSGSSQQQGSVRWQPGVGRGRPNSTLSGGRRGDTKYCNPDQPGAAPAVQLLVPDRSEGLFTISESPILAWSVETPKPTSMTFHLSHPDQADAIYTEEIAVQKSGIVRVALPAQIRLQPGIPYYWNVVVRCGNGLSSEIFARSSISRIPVPAGLPIRNASYLRQAKLYAERGIWYDALASMLLALDQAPTQTELQVEFNSLLEQARSAQR